MLIVASTGLLESAMSEAWASTCSANLRPSGTQIKVIIGALRLSYSALAGVFWLWLFPESMETTLDESLKNTF